MRISDWSSDGCSSDLDRTLSPPCASWQCSKCTIRRTIADTGRQEIVPVGFSATSSSLVCASHCCWHVSTVPLAEVGPRNTVAPESNVVLETLSEKIGRASCRERGWQYG